MQKILIPCKIVSPWFSYGAIKHKFEFRPSELIAGMRRWLRFYNDGDNLETIFEKESNLFGRGGKNVKSSDISIDFEISASLYPNERNNSIFKSFFENEVTCIPTYDRHNRQYIGSQYGIAYLFYTKNLSDNKEDEYALPISDNEGSNLEHDFTIILKGNSDDAMSKAVASLIALSVFDGVGSRRTRGAGCFEILFKKIKCIHQNTNTVNTITTKLINSIESLINNIEPSNLGQTIHNISQILSCILQSNGINLNKIQLDVFTLQEEDDLLHDSWFDALNSVGCILADYRLNLDSKDNVKFGLPNKKYNVTNHKSARRISPLCITLFSFNNFCIPLLYEINGQFLPPNAVIYDYAGKVIPNNSAIRNFLNNEFKLLKESE